VVEGLKGSRSSGASWVGMAHPWRPRRAGPELRASIALPHFLSCGTEIRLVSPRTGGGKRVSVPLGGWPITDRGRRP